MGKIHDRIKAKTLRTPIFSVKAADIIDDEIPVVATHGWTEPVLNNSLKNFKYVSSYDRVARTFTIDITQSWNYHADCYVPSKNLVKSAGWVSCPIEEYEKKDFTNMHTWGHSIGFQIGTHPRDLKMLREYLSNGSTEFDLDGNPV